MIKSLKNIILFLFSFTAFLFLMEIFIGKAEIESKSNFEVDSVFGKKLRPEVKLCYFNEGFMMGKTNRYGYLGPAYPQKKAENIQRIALIGDSFVESFQVFDRNSMRSELENRLNKKSDKKTEVLNFGRSGFVISDMYIYLQNFCSGFDPDLQFIFLHNIDFYEKSSQTLLPHLSFRENELITNNDFVNHPVFSNYQNTKYFRENSSFIRLMNNDLKLYKQKLHWQILLDKLYPSIEIKRTGEETNSTVSKNEISDINRKILKNWSREPGLYLIICEKPDASIQLVLEDSGIKRIDLYKTLNREKSSGKNLNYWPVSGKTGHWNQEGHKIISNLLSEYIQEYDLLQ